jgi:hypothetical protein
VFRCHHYSRHSREALARSLYPISDAIANLSVIFTIVLHDMQATNRENSHAVRYDVDPHGPHTIFVDHPTSCISRNSNHSVVRALMEVWWQHTAWSQFQQSVADTETCKCRKCCCISSNDRAYLIVEISVLGKVEVPIGVVGQKSMSIGIGCCGFEHSVQIWVERFGFGDKSEKRNEEIYRFTHRVWTGDRR